MKRGQVTVFIIIAIAIVATMLTFVFFKQKIIPAAPSKLQVLEVAFNDCVSNSAVEAIKIAESQGGYIDLPALDPPSSYMPFSNRLEFLGMEIPYWQYVSGNNIVKDQKPSKEIIEKQLSKYINDNIIKCSQILKSNFSNYVIEFKENPETNVKINAASVDVSVKWPIHFEQGDVKTNINVHKVSVPSSFGALYDDAVLIFENEKNKNFLENYSLDVLHLYAPVDGLELSCAPKIWFKAQVKTNVQEALAANIMSIKVKGTYYSSADKYFIFDAGRDISNLVNFVYLNSWPTRFEVWPSQGNIMRADAVGPQPGISLLGFCYVPYHFVYDLSFPVLIQISRENELFQFPVVVKIEKNMARNATTGETPVASDLCVEKTQDITVYTYDENLAPLETNVYSNCFGVACNLGTTNIEGGKAILKTKTPRCINAVIYAVAEGYENAESIVSTNNEVSVNLFLNKKYPVSFELVTDKGEKIENAILTINSSTIFKTLNYPVSNIIELSKGNYDISVLLFSEKNLSLAGQPIEKCIEVPASGIAGVFGAKSKECFKTTPLETTYTNVIYGGGKANFSFEKANKIKVKVPSFDIPDNIEKIADIYELIDVSELEVTVS